MYNLHLMKEYHSQPKFLFFCSKKVINFILLIKMASLHEFMLLYMTLSLENNQPLQYKLMNYKILKNVAFLIFYNYRSIHLIIPIDFYFQFVKNHVKHFINLTFLQLISFLIIPFKNLYLKIFLVIELEQQRQIKIDIFIKYQFI